MTKEPEIERVYEIEIAVVDGGREHVINARFTRHGAVKSAGFSDPSPRFESCYSDLISAGVVLGMQIARDSKACDE